MSSSTSDPATVPQAPAFSKDWWFRHALAFIVVGFSIVGIAVLSGIAIKGASAGTGRTEAIRLVFVSVLPLFGTWVGTVLAYYFARENLREATASVQAASAVTTEQLAKVWAPTTLVKDVMQPENRVERYVLKSSGTPPRQERVPNLELPELWKLLDGRPFDRLPIVDDANVVKALVARQDLTDWAAHQAGIIPDVFVGKKVKNFAPTPEEREKRLQNFVTVSPETTLAAASDKLAAQPDAKTVVVTVDGTDTGALAGLLTSTDLIGKVKP
jgi:CBS domain-containing protein